MKISKEKFIEEYKLLTIKQLTILYGVTRMTIWKKAKQLGLSKNRSTTSNFDF